MESVNKIAKISGFLYLGVIIFGIFAEVFVRQKLINFNNTEETVINILNSELLFRIGFVSDILMSLCWLLLPITLYLLLKHVNKSIATLMILFVVIGVGMQCINLLNQFATILILKGGDYLSSFSKNQLHSLVMLFLNIHKYGYMSAGIFHGLWLLPLGYLVYKSGYYPKILGILLIFAFIGFEVEFFGRFLISNYENHIIIIIISGLATVIGEFTFCGWLLFIEVQKLKGEELYNEEN